NVVFSTGANAASHITLGNGVTITADPPVAGVPVIHLADGVVAPVKTLSGHGAGMPNTPASAAGDSAISGVSSAPSTAGMRQDSTAFASSASLNANLVQRQNAGLVPSLSFASEASHGAWRTETELSTGEVPGELVTDFPFGVAQGQTALLEPADQRTFGRTEL